MRFTRSSGILLHPTSLPGPYGIGDLGAQAYAFVDFLSSAGCGLWQVLPLGPTGYGDSPYQCFSSFAGNPYLISPEELLEDGLLDVQDLKVGTAFPSSRVDYGRLIPWKLGLLKRACHRFFSTGNALGGTTYPPSGGSGALRREYEDFCSANAHWLEDYSLFMAIKEAHGGGSWENWPMELRRREPGALSEAGVSCAEAVARFSFYQFMFFRQWRALREYASGKGVRIIGDMPIFLAHDSADVWAHSRLFHLEDNGKPTVVAGVPPDFFSPTGQLWGNPLYNWDAHRETGYAWWLARMRALLQVVDIIRLDHFRGFSGCWEIPAGSKTAEKGHWVPGPGRDFLEALRTELGDLPVLAEDLGVITPDVVELLEAFGLPGMKVLQFAFSGPGNAYLPHQYSPNCVVYTGTHDNDTARGWYESASNQERDYACRYVGFSPGRGRKSADGFAWELVRAAWASVAVLALAPLQDLLDLGTQARMNTPNRLGGNWEWRMKEGVLDVELLKRLKELNWMYSRDQGEKAIEG